MNNYVIINANDIQKRIDDLESRSNSAAFYLESQALKKVIISSIPLMPEIENAYDAGILHNELSLSFDYPKNRYMSHLKFDI